MKTKIEYLISAIALSCALFAAVYSCHVRERIEDRITQHIEMMRGDAQ